MDDVFDPVVELPDPVQGGTDPVVWIGFVTLGAMDEIRVAVVWIRGLGSCNGVAVRSCSGGLQILFKRGTDPVSYG
jgi:hypothetical protein